MKKTIYKQIGFTLIELLVVISIITLLMAITVPVTILARGAARQTACKSNLRSIGWALRMYLDDNRNVMPPATSLPSAHLSSKPPITTFLKTYLSDPRISNALRTTADNTRTKAGRTLRWKVRVTSITPRSVASRSVQVGWREGEKTKSIYR